MSSDVVDGYPGSDPEDHNSIEEQWEDPTAPPIISKHDYDSDRYKMDPEERGTAIIFNNKTFDSTTNLSKRTGTDEDFNKIQDLLVTLNFQKIKPYFDCTAEQMKDFLRKAAEEDHSDEDCFIVVILSHGEEGYVYGTDDKVYVDELLQPFKGQGCRSLVGKPKLFFIQACKGQSKARSETVTDSGAMPETVTRIPREADFLMAYSVVPGYLAWNEKPVQGSWFIEAIIEVFNKHHDKMDVLTMLTKVNKKVAYNFESKAPEMYKERKKQIACITSTLTKDLYF